VSPPPASLPAVSLLAVFPFPPASFSAFPPAAFPPGEVVMDDDDDDFGGFLKGGFSDFAL
jgi:hypothetical protein